MNDKPAAVAACACMNTSKHAKDWPFCFLCHFMLFYSEHSENPWMTCRSLAKNGFSMPRRVKNAMQRINKEGNGVILILRWDESINAIMKDIEMIKKPNADISQDFDRRTLGVGGQILSDLGVTKMKLLSSPKTFYGLGGYGLEIEKYITE